MDERALTAATAQFAKCFQVKRFEPGVAIDFEWSAGALHVRVNGVAAGSVDDAAFARAFFAMYLSAQPKTADVKADVSRALSARYATTTATTTTH